MRSILKPLAGGALAVLLVLSASPAQAFGEQPGDADPTTSVESPETGAPQTEAPGAETPAEGDPAEENPAETGTPEAGEEDPAAESPEAAEPAVEEPEAAEPEAPAEPVAEAPETVEVTGTLLVLPDESSTMPLDLETGEPVESEAHTEAAHAGDRLVVATNEFGFVPLDAAASQGELVNGADFVGDVALPTAAIDAVQERIDAEGALAPVEVAETAHDAAAETGVEIDASGVATANPANADAGMGLDAPAAAAITAKSHAVDVVNFGGSARTAPTKAGLQKLVADVSAYWKNQTNGKVSGLSFSTYKALTPNVSRCDEYGLWNQAIWSYKNSNGTKKWPNANDYLKTGRHLLAVVNQNCGGAAGWGTTPASIHAGGVIWVDLGVLDSGQPTSDGTTLTAHEFGHNLGLGHGNARNCTSPKVDAPADAYGRAKSGSGCSDVEYGDLYNVMGSWFNGYGKKPAALAIGQRWVLGVAPSGSVKQVTTAGGAVQTFTIRAAGMSSGLRGLRVTGPGSAGTAFVEFRKKLGQDSGTPWDLTYRGPISGNYIAAGVRVMRTYSNSPTYDAKKNVVLSRWASGKRYQTMRTGNVLQPSGGTMQVRVNKFSTEYATVSVEYKGFRNGGKTVTTDLADGSPLIAGKRLKARITGGAWKLNSGFGSTTAPAGTKDNYQWYRNGAAIKGATSSVYRTTASDIGKKVTVKVFPTASGYVKGNGSTSGARTVVKPTFVDVLWNNVHYKGVEWMAANNYVKSGTSTPKYYPKNATTRGAFATMLMRKMEPNYQPKSTLKLPFRDVKKTDPHYKGIAWMYQRGYAAKASKFNTSNPVTRGALATFMQRMEAPSYKPKSTLKLPYSDVPKSYVHYKGIAWMYQKGYAAKASKYNPKNSTTRGAMATFLYRIYS
ncbi:hypothetical protein D3248_12630 [Leucobacter zeae]|nr:hypothetical protein [Leucobacter zeae]